MRLFLLALAGWLAVAIPVAGTASAETFRFRGDDGGFSQIVGAGWTYGPVPGPGPAREGWFHRGFGGPGAAVLASPGLLVASDGDVDVRLRHAYSFEEPFDFYDGGRLRVSVNGGPTQLLRPEGGYALAPPGPGREVRTGCAAFDGGRCWSGDSGGLVTDSFTLPALSAGDTLDFFLVGRWDIDVNAPGIDWEIARLAVSNTAAVPLPAPALLLLGGLAGLGLAGRRRGG